MALPQFIAEVSSNHAQSLERCFAFIDTAKEIGCSGVKFQLFRVEELFAQEILTRSAKHRQRKDWELPIEFVPKLAGRCLEKNIQFGCTPFYLEAVEELKPYVDFYKISSYELLWDTLLENCASTGKPIILSTGMADTNEIDHAVQVLRDNGCVDLTLLHCVSGYPAPVGECNLAFVEYLQKRYGCSVGWSDHSRSHAVLYRAIHRWNAIMVEFHLDLDGSGSEYESGHCWLPSQIAEVIDGVQHGCIADGDGNVATQECESADRDWRADPEDGLRPLLKIRKSFVPLEQV